MVLFFHFELLAQHHSRVTSPSTSSNNRLTLKRLAPGLVELPLHQKGNLVQHKLLISKEKPLHFLHPIGPPHYGLLHLFMVQTPTCLCLSNCFPLFSVQKQIKLLKADVSAQPFVKMGFVVEKNRRDGDVIVGFPEWRTKPDTVGMHFEVLAKVDGNKVVPGRAVPFNPVIAEDSV